VLFSTSSSSCGGGSRRGVCMGRGGGRPCGSLIIFRSSGQDCDFCMMMMCGFAGKTARGSCRSIGPCQGRSSFGRITILVWKNLRIIFDFVIFSIGSGRFFFLSKFGTSSRSRRGIQFLGFLLNDRSGSFLLRLATK